jgi:hypothetical protein
MVLREPSDPDEIPWWPGHWVRNEAGCSGAAEQVKKPPWSAPVRQAFIVDSRLALAAAATLVSAGWGNGFGELTVHEHIGNMIAFGGKQRRDTFRLS